VYPPTKTYAGTTLTRKHFDRYTPSGRKRNLTTTYTARIDHIQGNSAPYFCITHETTTARGTDISGGRVPDEQLKHLPAAWRNAERWCLATIHGIPIHYIDNAIWHAGRTEPSYWNPTPTPNYDHFAAAIVWGAVETDTPQVFEALKQLNADQLRAYLTERLPHLWKAFDADMIALFGPDVLRLARHQWDADSKENTR
jgi:hypothetical protein